MTAPADAGPAMAGRVGLSSTAVAVLAGALAVVMATVVGVVLALALSILGLTTTPVWPLGAWLGGLGLLGGWRQDVTATVAGGLEWSTWAAGAPLLVTAAAMAVVAVTARRSWSAAGPGWGGAARGALLSAAGAAVASAVLVAVSRTSAETVTDAGSVVRAEGLTWLWTGGTRPGTLVGAAVLVGGTWLVAAAGGEWWRQGRALAYGLLLWPGLFLTVVVGLATAYVTSSPAVGVASVLLFPLIGVLVVLGLGGAPVEVGLTRLSPEPYLLSVWDTGPVYGLVGLAVVLVLAVVVGAVLGLRRHPGGWVPGLTVPVAVAAAVAWATDASVVVPESLGGPTRASVGVLTAATVAVVMAAVALAVRGPARMRGRPQG